MSFQDLLPGFELEILPPSKDHVTKNVTLINSIDRNMQFKGLCGFRKLLLTDSQGTFS